MKGKFTHSARLPKAMVEAINSTEFVGRFLDDVIGDVFGAEHPRFRPAEYYVQQSDIMVEVGKAEGVHGVIFTLSGVSRLNNREPRVFHEALRRTTALCIDVIQQVLGDGEVVHLFVNMMISGDVPLSPKTGGGYSNVHESEAVWITVDDVSNEMPAEILDRAKAHWTTTTQAQLAAMRDSGR